MKLARMAVLVALAAGLVGCSSDEEDSIPLVRVKGTVTRNGEPLGGAKVSFMPQSGNRYSTPGVDETGPDGNYLVRFKGRTGVAAGKYKVVVTPPIELPAGAKLPEEFKDDPLMGQMALGIGPDSAKAKDNGKSEPTQAEFDAEVDAKDVSRTLDFDVKQSKDKKPAA